MYNVPPHLVDLDVVAVEHAFLPVYVIETMEHGLLAYTEAAPTRDEFLEDVFRQIPTMDHLIAGQRQDDPEKIWTDWLAELRSPTCTSRPSRRDSRRDSVCASGAEVSAWPVVEGQ